MSGWLRQSVVVPVDFSDESFAAVDEALKMVAAPEAVHVLHVLPELSPVEPGEMWSTITEESRKEHVIKALRERLHGASYEGLQFAARIGSPAHQIVAYAEELEADTIVLPSRGVTGLAHILIGSVAERVVRHAHCPVVVLRDGRSTS